MADVLQREGVIDNNRWAFIGSVFALKARSELKPGEYLFQKNASLRDVSVPWSTARWCSMPLPFRKG